LSGALSAYPAARDNSLGICENVSHTMLANRTYSPTDGETLYHYCTPETFLTVCNAKTLRFSDLFAMNDFLEVRWGYHVWEKAAGELLDKVGREFLDEIDLIIHESGGRMLPLASCLSRQGDVLSQWRAYGSDGKGYAIGFDPKALAQLPVRMLKVEYDFEVQVVEAKQFILALHEVESVEPSPRGEGFFEACARFAVDLSSFKNPAFREEDEVRLVHLLNFERSNASLKLVDAGGTSFARPATRQQVKFRITEGTPVAYLDIDFANGGAANPVTDVVLGPKNESLLSGVSVFLETMSLPNVKLTKSRASYR
jgi:hypothetical protein